METQIVKKATTLATLKLTRVSNGAELFIRAPMIEQWIKEHSSGTTGYGHDPAVWQSESPTFHRLTSEPTLSAPYRFLAWGRDAGRIDSLLVAGEAPNLSPMLMVGISEGKSILFPGMFPASALEQYLQCAKRALVAWYRDYMAQRSFSVEIGIRED